MAVSGMSPGDGYTKTTRDSIVVESGTLAYTPTELASFARQPVPTISPTVISTPTLYPTLGNDFLGGGGTSFPTGGTTGGIQITNPYICGVLQTFGYPCTTQGAAQAIAAGVNLFTDTNNQPGAAATCPDGYQVNPQTGVCERTGVGGAIERMLPGGSTGTLTDQYGPATIGGFGIPALVPAQVGTIKKANGTTGPILKCPPGAVLGKDDLCYQKSSIPRSYRKWPKPSTRCPISARDWKAIKAIGRVQKTIRKVAGEAGMTAKKR